MNDHAVNPEIMRKEIIAIWSLVTFSVFTNAQKRGSYGSV